MLYKKCAHESVRAAIEIFCKYVNSRYEAHMHTLLKYIHSHETKNLLSKKGVSVGTVEFEFGVSYGSFGYGQSYQLTNDMYTTKVKTVFINLFPLIL